MRIPPWTLDLRLYVYNSPHHNDETPYLQLQHSELLCNLMPSLLLPFPNVKGWYLNLITPARNNACYWMPYASSIYVGTSIYVSMLPIRNTATKARLGNDLKTVWIFYITCCLPTAIVNGHTIIITEDLIKPKHKQPLVWGSLFYLYRLK